ncbi:MAG: hypothetical protein R2822_23015 [Spirosomataceae bacterium]
MVTWAGVTPSKSKAAEVGIVNSNGLGALSVGTLASSVWAKVKEQNPQTIHKSI